MKYTDIKHSAVNVTYATYVYKITDVTDTEVSFVSLTRHTTVSKHAIKYGSTFPYHKLKIGEIYTIVSVKWRYTYHFLMAWPLTGVEIIINDDLRDYIYKNFNEQIPVT